MTRLNLRRVLSPLGLGPKLLRLRRAIRFGFRAEWKSHDAKIRYLRKIGNAKPLPSGEGPTDCFMLLNEPRIWEGLWSLYSFRHHFGACRLVVLDDGTLRPKSIALLRTVLPGITIPEFHFQDSTVCGQLERQQLWRCLEWRRQRHYVFTRKLFDPLFLSSSEHMVLLDSDYLHFNSPCEVREAFDGPRMIRYVSDTRRFSLCADPGELAELCRAQLPEYFCAGFLYVPRASVQLRRLEHYLSHPIFTRQLHRSSFEFLAEQTLWAMEAAVIGAKALPPTYGTCPDVEQQAAIAGHFCGGVVERTWFYTKGLPLLTRQFHAADLFA